MKPIRERLEAWGLNPGNNIAIEEAMLKIHYRNHEILWRAFNQNESLQSICFGMNINMCPATAFIDAFLAAEQALETALKGIEK